MSESVLNYHTPITNCLSQYTNYNTIFHYSKTKI